MKMTRKDKRLLEEDSNLFKEALKNINHFFPEFFKVVNKIDDPRHQSYIKYKESDLIMVRLLGFMCHFSSMNQMNEELNKHEVIDNLTILCGNHIKEVPHGDTINKYLKEVDMDQMRTILQYIVQAILAKRLLDEYRMNGKYYHVVIDGTQMYSYAKKHVENCLVRKYEDGNINYHSDMLVANITMGNIMIPLDFEMIENEIVGASKQDCETKAAKRMLARIKRNYKRLPICFSGDGLYFSEPILNICKEYNWKYIITYKEGCASSVEEYYQVAKRYSDVTKYHIEKNREIEQNYEFYNGIEYRGNKVNMVKMEEISKESSTTFCYVSNFNITTKNVAGLVQHGRNRWKIENKSFNDMKNHGYHLGHAFSYNSNAIQGHFLILMIACLMMQLLEYKERVKKRFTTIRKMGMEIKEALRNTVLSAKDIREIFQATQFRRSISYT